ncbi:hypothetical protein BC831DRAFT_454378 [Entophlyctis helioformis]|nr:hypothetical protein BC831DRAFT_454378 [Entophlyctis helioformis]
MGGHGHGKYPPVLTDPAVEKWYFMRENTHTHFKFTPRTIKYSVVLTLLIPGFVWYYADKYHNTWKVTGARRGESFYFPIKGGDATETKAQ